MTSQEPSSRSRRPRGRWLLSAVAVVVACLTVGSLSVAGSSAAPYTSYRSFTPVTGPTFNRPVGTSAQQRAIFTQLNRSIAATRRGETIRMAVFSFSEKATADALLAAHRRGVHVKLIFDDHIIYAQEARLRRALGADATKRSFVVYCHRSCRSTGGNMHAKFFTFSRVGNARYVSMTGSNNITRHNAVDQWSDVYTVVRNRTVFDSFKRIFTQMKMDRPLSNTYRSTVAGRFQTQFFPSGKLPQEDDPVYQALEKIGCEGSTHTSGPPGTAVRIAMHAWNGDRGIYLARKVAELRQQGCRVYVVYGVGMGTRVKNILAEAGVALSAGTRQGIRTHQKTLSVRGVYGDDTAASIVWTGSHNWSDGSLVRDEVIFRIDDAATHRRYYRNFTDMWRNG
jgi:phosphatidylserine/phosphatidylglycerophosphate/cardiolipin synthase-like enzyme